MSTTSGTAPPGPPYLILACDGGGIRGLITALMLQQLVTDFPNLLSQIYLFAGTSTGGIISLALAAKVLPEKLVTLYSTDGQCIFTESACAKGDASTDIAQVAAVAAASVTAAGESWWGKLITFIAENLDELICCWYTNKNLESQIQTTLALPANATLSSLAPTDGPFVMVNTMQLCESTTSVWKPLQLTNLNGLPNNESADTLVIEAAMSTSAAPIYFPPYYHSTYGYCVDGGMFANNPGTIAITTLLESTQASLEDIWMLSLGTGNTQDCYPPAAITDDLAVQAVGPLFWLWPEAQTNGAAFTPALPLMSAFFDGTSDIDDYQCRQLLGDRYQRANVTLTSPVALDDTTQAAITTMTDSTKTYMGTDCWTAIESWITKNFPLAQSGLT